MFVLHLPTYSGYSCSNDDLHRLGCFEYLVFIKSDKAEKDCSDFFHFRFGAFRRLLLLSADALEVARYATVVAVASVSNWCRGSRVS